MGGVEGEARALARVVAAMTRAIRAMGYYDAQHPVFEQSKREAFAALSEAWRDRTIVTLGSGGRALVIDAEGNRLADALSADLAARMFNLSVVAIRIHDHAAADDLGALTKLLSESAEKVRAAGGARALLDVERVQGIDIIEVDFAALFAGHDADLSPMVEGDPIAELALRLVLRFKDDDEEKSDVLSVSLEKLGTPDSLGRFLDELLDKAQPGVVADAADEWGSLSGDDLADHAAQAYLANQKNLGKDQKSLAASARVLSDALVRLSPDARFALLRKLAGKDEGAPHEEQAVRELGGAIRDEQIVEAIASALMDRTSDSDSVRAIGNLIRRIRPVEAERHRLLATVDQSMFARKKPIDGVLWQQIQSHALGDSALGLLEIDLGRNKEGLARAAQSRLRGKARPVVGQDLLYTFDRLAVSHRAARAMASLIGQPGRLGAELVSAVEAMVMSLLEQDDDESVLGVIGALVRKLDRDRDTELDAAVKRLLAGERGAIWSAKLLVRGLPPGRMLGDLILNALEGAGDRDSKEMLIDRLAKFDAVSLLELGEQAIDADPMRVHHLVRAALRADPKVGVKIARIALRNESYKAKDLALKALIEAPGMQSLALLAHVAGWKGEKHTHALVATKSGDARVHRLQMTAIGSLGLTRSPVAVKPLFDLLTQKRLFESKEMEEVRLGAAQALMTNATAQAREALEEGSRHPKKNVRDACIRVLGKRR